MPCTAHWPVTPLARGPSTDESAAQTGALTCSASHTDSRTVSRWRGLAQHGPRRGRAARRRTCQAVTGGGQCGGEQRPRGEWREDRRHRGGTWGTPPRVAPPKDWNGLGRGLDGGASGELGDCCAGPEMSLAQPSTPGKPPEPEEGQGGVGGSLLPAGPAVLSVSLPDRNMASESGVAETDLFRLRPCWASWRGKGTDRQPQHPPLGEQRPGSWGWELPGKAKLGTTHCCPLWRRRPPGSHGQPFPRSSRVKDSLPRQWLRRPGALGPGADQEVGLQDPASEEEVPARPHPAEKRLERRRDTHRGLAACAPPGAVDPTASSTVVKA